MPQLAPEALRALRRDLGDAATAHEVAQVVRTQLPRLQGAELVAAVHEVLADAAGLGPLRDAVTPGVTDVLVCSHDLVYRERDGVLERIDATWSDESALRAFAVRLATAAGVRLDQLHPFADFQLPGGLRCHIVLPPLAAATSISVRIPRQDSMPLSLTELLGGQPDVIVQAVCAVVASGRSYLISGGTGSGKTTLLAAMVGQVPSTQRIVIVEDAAELGPVHPHAVHLRARPASSEGVGEVTLRTMVRQALRMRPDRLIVGEVRGVEVLDLLAAMNTGHQGAAATVHANTATQVGQRIRSLCLMAGVPVEAADALFATAVDLVIHVERAAGGARRVAGIAVTSAAGERIVPALTVSSDGTVHRGPGIDTLTEMLQC